MWLNYLKISLRAAVGNRLFSAINVVGLAIGFVCFLLIGLYVNDELRYDRHYANAERIYRLSPDVTPNDGSPDTHWAASGPLVAEQFKQEFEEIERTARLRPWRVDLAYEGSAFRENAAFADNDLFAIFDFHWLQGDVEAALLQPFTTVLTASVARKYFGDADPLGQTLLLQGSYPVQVTGVIEDLPRNTHLRFDMLLSMPTAPTLLGSNALTNPTLLGYHTYVLLRAGASIDRIVALAPDIYERYLGEGASAIWGLTAMRLTDIHLHSHRESELNAPGSSASVYAFSAIALIILLMACFNFMNLAIARGLQRAKEVGVRKTLGALRVQMLVQFIAEAVLMAAFAMIVAIAAVELLLPAFNAFLQKQITFAYFGNVWTIPALALLVVLTGTVAGAYPAFYLSAFAPSRVLKGIAAAGRRSVALRGVLVVVQFSIAIVLLVATAVVFLQMRFASAIELGYDKDQIVVLSTTGREGLGRQWDAMKERLLAAPEIESVTASNVVPASSVATSYFIRHEGGTDQRTMPVLLVDFEFFETYGIRLLAGRSFSKALDPDRAQAANPSYIVNALAARQLGWSPEEAIGKGLEVTCCNFGNGTIVGVVDDVYFESLHMPLAPTVYLVPPEPAAVIHSETRLGLQQASIRIRGNDAQGALARIRETWTAFFPNQPASLRLLQDDFDALYQSEYNQNRMLFGFSALAIFIACLGLFGLASFSTERRRKEIGVRKVMGGSVWSIVRLVTHEFSRLVLLANLIAWPVAYLVMQRWLAQFAYRIDLTPLVFIGSGAIALCIAWVTVGAIAAKAASGRPVLALRYE